MQAPVHSATLLEIPPNAPGIHLMNQDAALSLVNHIV